MHIGPRLCIVLRRCSSHTRLPTRNLAAWESTLATSTRSFSSAAADPVQNGERPHAVLHPPGVGGTDLSIERFIGLVDRAIAAGEVLDVEVQGARATTNTMRALALTKRTTSEFQVEFSGDGTGGPKVKLQISAQRGDRWEEFMKKDFTQIRRMFVKKDTNTMGLAQGIAMTQAKSDAVIGKAYTDSDPAVFNLVKAVATSPHVHFQRRMVCVPNLVQHDEGEALYLYIRASSETERRDRTMEGTFHAYPPGANAQKEQVNRFIGSVVDRIGSGSTVEMQAIGGLASANALLALSRARVDTAEFEVRWHHRQNTKQRKDTAESGPDDEQTEGQSGQQSEGVSQDQGKQRDKQGQILYTLKFQGARGVSWEDFNNTDFSKNAKLIVTDSTDPQKLAQAISAEIMKVGSVAIHTYFDNIVAVHKLAKGLAFVPVVSSGLRLLCVPSIKILKHSTADGSRGRHLRIYARMLEKNRHAEKTPEQ